MTYPPEHHLLRDLRIRGTRTGDEVRNATEVVEGMRDASGGLRLGVLATLLDMTGAAVALGAVQPDWIATADLSAHALRPVRDGWAEVVCRLLRVGAGRVVIEATMVDDEGVDCGRGLMAFARLPGSATTATIGESTGEGGRARIMEGGVPLTESILDRCGFEPVGPGQLRFEKTGYVRNSFGTVNGGVVALAAEAAAVSACREGHAVDLHVHYLEQIGDGPAGVTAEVVRHGERERLCEVRLTDLADGRLAAVADVIVSVGESRSG